MGTVEERQLAEREGFELSQQVIDLLLPFAPQSLRQTTLEATRKFFPEIQRLWAGFGGRHGIRTHDTKQVWRKPSNHLRDEDVLRKQAQRRDRKSTRLNSNHKCAHRI